MPSSLAENGIGEGWARSLNNDAPVISGEAECLTLSARQREVLLLLARGMSNKEIAEALHIAESTSKIHTAAVLRALGVRNRTEAAIKAMKLTEIENGSMLNLNTASPQVGEDERVIASRGSTPKIKVYPVHVMTRKSFGLMTRKLSVTESQRSAQFRGTVSRRKPSVASANWAHVA